MKGRPSVAFRTEQRAEKGGAQAASHNRNQDLIRTCSLSRIKKNILRGYLVVAAPAQIVSREHYPWLYYAEPTLLVFRVILFKAAEQDKLLQPVLIGTGIKQQLKAGGYLP